MSYKYFFFHFFFSWVELAFISIIISYLIISYHMFVSFIENVAQNIQYISKKEEKKTLFCCCSCIIIYLEGEVRDFEMLTILTFKRTTYTHIFIFFIFSSSSLLSSSLSLFPTILTYYLLDYISLFFSLSFYLYWD